MTAPRPSWPSEPMSGAELAVARQYAQEHVGGRRGCGKRAMDVLSSVLLTLIAARLAWIFFKD